MKYQQTYIHRPVTIFMPVLFVSVLKTINLVAEGCHQRVQCVVQNKHQRGIGLKTTCVIFTLEQLVRAQKESSRVTLLFL